MTGGDPEATGGGDTPGGGGDAASGSAEAASNPVTASRGRRPDPSPPLPWYRRGSVWFGFVVVSVIAVLVIADLAEDRIYSYDVDPAGEEAAAWCEAASPIHAGLGFWGGLIADEAVHQRRIDALEAAAEVAPGEISDDLDEVIDLEHARQDRAVELAERRAAGEVVSDDLVDDLRDDHHVAVDRVEGFDRQACPIG